MATVIRIFCLIISKFSTLQIRVPIAYSDRRRGDVFKLKEGRFKLDIRKKFFTIRVLKHWHKLPREVVDTPSREVFMARLDRFLSNLV